ncbi:hypothetical protein MMC25_004008 [Agyrium rufum]|nr:hypothetical protein [Agyrium rufum]
MEQPHGLSEEMPQAAGLPTPETSEVSETIETSELLTDSGVLPGQAFGPQAIPEETPSSQDPSQKARNEEDKERSSPTRPSAAKSSPEPPSTSSVPGLTLNVRSPSNRVPPHLTLSGITRNTTIREVKNKIQSSIPSGPSPEDQRLIYRARPLVRDDMTVEEIFGQEELRHSDVQTLHLVLPPSPRASSAPTLAAIQPPLRPASTGQLGTHPVPRPPQPPLFTPSGLPPPPVLNAGSMQTNHLQNRLPPEMFLGMNNHWSAMTGTHGPPLGLPPMNPMQMQMPMMQNRPMPPNDVAGLPQPNFQDFPVQANGTQPNTQHHPHPMLQHLHQQQQALMMQQVQRHQEMVQQWSRHMAQPQASANADSPSIDANQTVNHTPMRTNPSQEQVVNTTNLETATQGGPPGGALPSGWRMTVNTSYGPAGQFAPSGQSMIPNLPAQMQQMNMNTAGQYQPPVTPSTQVPHRSLLPQQNETANRPQSQVPPSQPAPRPTPVQHLHVVPPPRRVIPTSSLDTSRVYLLNSPAGPQALLVHPAGLYSSAGFDLSSVVFTDHNTPDGRTPSSYSHSSSSLSPFDPSLPPSVGTSSNRLPALRAPFVRPTRTTPTPPNQPQNGDHQAAPEAPPHNDAQNQNQNHNQPANPDGDQVNDLVRILMPLGGHLWLLLRLFGFIYFFMGGAGWQRMALVSCIAIAIFISQTEAFQPLIRAVWDPLRRHIEGLVPLAALPEQAHALPRGGGGIEARLLARPPGRAADGRTPSSSSSTSIVARGLRPGSLAERLRAVRAEREARGYVGSLQGYLRRVERATALFIASLIPGVGERHIAARDAAEAALRAAREEEERMRMEEEIERLKREKEDRHRDQDKGKGKAAEETVEMDKVAARSTHQNGDAGSANSTDDAALGVSSGVDVSVVAPELGESSGSVGMSDMAASRRARVEDEDEEERVLLEI